jgi:hypothetical protein
VQTSTLEEGGILTLEEVAHRMRRSMRFVEQQLHERVLGYIAGRPLLVREEEELWRYLIQHRIIWPDAFGPNPRSPSAEAALRAAQERVLQDRLDQLDLEAGRRERMSEAVRQRAKAPHDHSARSSAGGRINRRRPDRD